ncbi:glycosyltransferase family 4 protein [Luteimonas marina]|uniref:Glycosyltransferase family 4 protein n=1 Tax=Luteimonas marina TaxID=488485 RepID=A0A5C5U651_9GAMM|nr:glycosyltransferase family 4 protein [Luteimonas marina]TWT21092.1 glycosyltransferase family 4 protein [Luteimonas marina]
MHILSSPTAGGAEVYVKDLALAMAAEGHFVAVAFLNHAHEVGRQQSYEQNFLEELAAGGVEVDFIGYKARRSPVFGWTRLRQMTGEWRPDVIHSHLSYGLLFAAFCPVPVVYTQHTIKLRVPAWLYRVFLDRVVSRYIGICAACVNVLNRASSRPVVRIDNAVSPERVWRRPQDSRRDGTVKLFSAGRLTEAKNYTLLLESVAELDDMDFTLEIAGEGPLRGVLEQQIEQHQLAHRVKLLGNVNDVSERLAGADIFVMSSSWEGLPIALLEATLTGLPVVVTNVGGCAEVVHRVGNGLVVDTSIAKDLAAAMRRLIASESQRSFFSHNALNYSASYELGTAVALHMSLYRDVVDAKSP